MDGTHHLEPRLGQYGTVTPCHRLQVEEEGLLTRVKLKVGLMNACGEFCLRRWDGNAFIINTLTRIPFLSLSYIFMHTVSITLRQSLSLQYTSFFEVTFGFL